MMSAPYPLWWDEHLHPEDRERASAGVLAVIESGGQFWSGEYRFRRADQSYAHILDRGYIMRDQQGVPICMIGAMQDITERKRVEQALRASEETARSFQEQLKALHRLSSELSAATSFDDLCRMAVELGCSRLGFDRLGLWFIDDDPRFKLGSFGIDEQGNLRDERGIRTRIGTSSLPEDVFFDAFPMHFDDDAELYNGQGEVVGRGWNGMAALWDSERPIGFISADNLLSRLPVSPYQMELLTLYGSTLGYLVVRMRAALGVGAADQPSARFSWRPRTRSWRRSAIRFRTICGRRCGMSMVSRGCWPSAREIDWTKPRRATCA